MFNLIKYELKKLLSHKIIFLLIIIIVLSNVYLITRDISDDMVGNNIALKRLTESYATDPDGTTEYINDYISRYNKVVKARKETGNKDIPFPEDRFIKDTTSSYDSDYTFISKEFNKIKNIDVNFKKRVKAAIQIANSQIAEYEYLGYSKTSFDYAYQQGVVDSYSNLENISFPIQHISGYNILMFYEGFGVISMIAMLAGGLLFVIPDKNIGMYQILRVSKKGRFQTIIAKLVVSLLFCFIVCLLLDISAVLAVEMKLGISGGDAPIQMLNSFFPDSKETYMLCPYNVTIFQGFLINCLIRFFSSFTFLCVIILLSSIFSHYIPSFILGIGFVGLNYYLANYLFLNDYDPVKNLNFFVNINGYKPINYWKGLKIFDSVLPVLESTIILFSCLIVLSIILTIVLFVTGKGFSFGFLTKMLSNIRSKITKIKVFKKKDKIFNPKSITNYELKKIFTRFSLIVLIVILIANFYLSISNFTKPLYLDEKIYENVISEYLGEWNIDKHNSINEKYSEYRYLISIKDEMAEKYMSKEITGLEYSQYIEKYQTAEFEFPYISDLKNISENLKESYQKGEKAYFINEIGWTRLYKTSFSYLYLIAFILIFSNCFSIEFREDFNKILKSTKYRNKTAINKILIAIIFTTSFILICESIQYFMVNYSYTLYYPLASANNISIFENVNNNTIIGVFLLKLLREIVVSNLFIMFILLISRVTKKLLPTLVSGAVIAFTPTILNYFGITFLNDLSLVRLLSRM